MATMDGRAASFVPGVVPLNQEPLYNAVGKKLLEKTYEVHRTRVLNAVPMVDARLRVFDFLTDQSWKLLSKRHQELELMKHNEIIYGRISKVENQESSYTRERREHVKNIEHQSKHSKRLKEVGRLRAVMKIQRENEHMHQRIQKAKPYYSRAKFQKAYKHHELFKNAKRADHTAGHLLKIKKAVAPKPIVRGELDSLTEAVRKMKTKIERKGMRGGVERPQMSASQSILTPLPSLSKSVESGGFQFKPSASLTSLSEKGSLLGRKGKGKKKGKKGKQSQSESEYKPSTNEDDGDDYNDDGEYADEFEDAGDIESPSASSKPQTKKRHKKSKPKGEQWQKMHEQLFAIPFDTKNCSVQVLIDTNSLENVMLRVCNVDAAAEVMSERRLTLDEVHSYLDGGQTSLFAPDSGSGTKNNEDAHALRSMLINMFREADREQRGFLTYDEFQTLMEKSNLGITAQEIKFVISEADENDDGFIAYNEFVPLAVDMILAFRARAHAKHSGGDSEEVIEDEVLKMLSGEELEGIATICLDKIKDKDFDGVGALPPNALKRALQEVMGCGLSSAEVQMIVKQLPRDSSGRCIILTFKEVLYQVRFLSIKNTITEAQGTDIQKYLTELCTEEEKRVRDEGGEDTLRQPPGHLTLRSVIDLMLGSPRLSLSRLQVMVIASEATIIDGFVDYHAFVPMAARVIEQMYDPGALKQRAALIEQSEMGGGSTVHGLAPDVFQRRLLNLFKSYDTDRSGSLDAHEFQACMDSMDLHLTNSEVMALMTAADTDGSGHVDMDEFTEFCTHNLMHLEREKHIRSLQASMKKQSKAVAEKSGEEAEARLRELFNIADADNSGFLSTEELSSVFQSLDMQLSTFQLQVLLSEADANGDGLICIDEFLPIAMDLLTVLKVNDNTTEEKKKMESDALKEADRLTHGMQDEIQAAGKYIRGRIKDNNVPSMTDPEEIVAAVKEILSDPRAGLSRTEVPHVIKTLMPHRPSSRDAMSTSIPISFDLSNLELGIFEARKLTVMFGLMDNKDKGIMETHILTQLETRAKELQVELGLPETPVYIPVRACFEVLEASTSLRFHRAQLVAIISWADCFDENGIDVDYRRFARYAADMMTGMLSSDQISKRNKIKGEVVTDEAAMSGLTEPMLQKYLTSVAEELHKKRHGHGHFHKSEGVLSADLLQVIKKIPKINLSNKEASTIMAQMPLQKDDLVHWQDIIPSAYSTVLTICRERMVSRRVELTGTNNNDEEGEEGKKENEIAAMKRLGTRLLQIVKVRASSGRNGVIVSVVFPHESADEATDNVSDHDDTTRRPVGMSGLEAELMRAVKILEIRNRRGKTISKMATTIRITENDTFSFPEKAQLEMHVMSMDSSFELTTDVPIRLPSCGLVDSEVALDVARNIVQSSYLLQMPDKTLSLRVMGGVDDD